jgi:hypothetical protein
MSADLFAEQTQLWQLKADQMSFGAVPATT